MEMTKKIGFNKGDLKGIITKVAEKRGKAPQTIRVSLWRGSTMYIDDIMEEIKIREAKIEEFNNIMKNAKNQKRKA